MVLIHLYILTYKLPLLCNLMGIPFVVKCSHWVTQEVTIQYFRIQRSLQVPARTGYAQNATNEKRILIVKAALLSPSPSQRVSPHRSASLYATVSAAFLVIYRRTRYLDVRPCIFSTFRTFHKYCHFLQGISRKLWEILILYSLLKYL